jgi:hypothetical protein
MKLIKVANELYRNESGSVTVVRHPARDVTLPWLMLWKDFLGARHQKRFATLADARKELKSK